MMKSLEPSAKRCGERLSETVLGASFVIEPDLPAGIGLDPVSGHGLRAKDSETKFA